MLKHKELYNPINRTEEISDDVFLKYISIYDNQYKLMPTGTELIHVIKEDFYESHRNTEKSALDQVWHFVQEKIQRNEALAQFILDFEGTKSSYFFPWLISVFNSPSEALELGYKAGRNLIGEWVNHIPDNDRITFFAENAPTVAYNRERQLRVADLVMSDRELLENSQISHIVDLGAGRLAWARHHGFIFNPYRQYIRAFDMDPNIDPDKLFSRDDLTKLNLSYERKDLRSVLQDPAVVDISLAILGGVASYYPTEVFKEAIIRPLYGKLRHNGNFFFDLQLAHPAYIWSVKTFDWPEMKLPGKASEAIDIVEDIRKTLWQDGLKFGAEYALDTYNKSPLSVMVLLTKV